MLDGPPSAVDTYFGTRCSPKEAQGTLRYLEPHQRSTPLFVPAFPTKVHSAHICLAARISISISVCVLQPVKPQGSEPVSILPQSASIWRDSRN